MSFLYYSRYVFNTSITWYSIFVLVGAIVAYLFSKYFYKKEPLSKEYPDLLETLFLVAFPCGLVGARIWYIFSELSDYLADPISMLKVWEGGLAIQGGVLGGILAGYIVLKVKKIKISFRRMVDIIVPNILIAQSIGRWGNFFNHEVYGSCVDRESLWWIPNFILDNMEITCLPGRVNTPLFLYEALFTFLGFVLISIVIRKFYKNRVDGELGAMYLLYYGLVRIIMEPMREEIYIMRIFGNISMSMLTSALFILAGIGIIVYLEINRKKLNEERNNG